MSDEYDDYEEEAQHETSTIQQLRSQLKDQAARLKEAETLKERAAKADELEKRVAFFEADLPRDLNEARRKAILATASEPTPEGFRKAAEDLGFIDAPAPTVPTDELQAMDRIAGAAAGGTNTVDVSNYEAEIAAARTPEEVFAIKAKHGRGGRAVAD